MRIGDYEVRKLTGKDALLLRRYEPGERVEVPSDLGGLCPVFIGPGFLPRRNCVRSLVLPCSVEEIDAAAFSAFRHMESIEAAGKRLRSKDGVLYDGGLGTLLFYPPEKEGDEYIAPPGLRRIAPTAFASGTSLKSLVLPSSVEELAFKASDAPLLSEIFIEKGKGLRSSDSVVYKGKSLVFYPWGKTASRLVIEPGTERLEAELPPSVKSLHAPRTLREGLERAGEGLEEVEVEKENRALQSSDGVLFSSVSLLRYPGRKKGTFYIVPGWVRRVSDRAFKGAELRTLVLSEGVEELGSEAFLGSSVETLSLPSSLRRIDLRALSGMEALKELWIARGSYAEVFLSALPGEFSVRFIPENPC